MLGLVNVDRACFAVCMVAREESFEGGKGTSMEAGVGEIRVCPDTGACGIEKRKSEGS